MNVNVSKACRRSINQNTPTTREWRKMIATWLTKAEAGDISAFLWLGYCYSNGFGVPKDWEQSVFWYGKAARKGHASAVCAIGLLLSSKSDPSEARDLRKAHRYFLRAAKLGNVEAATSVGYDFLHGVGVRANPRLGVTWTKKAALRGDVMAQYGLALCYIDGKGVGKAPRRAVRWLRKASARGYLSARLEMAYCYLDGIGVPKDIGKALRQFRAMAAAGDPEAIGELGLLYHNGVGVKRNLRKAFTYYRTAAKGGDPWAQYFLGLSYLEGEGTRVNRAQSEKWLRLAASNGIAEAASALAEREHDFDFGDRL